MTLEKMMCLHIILAIILRMSWESVILQKEKLLSGAKNSNNPLPIFLGLNPEQTHLETANV